MSRFEKKARVGVASAMIGASIICGTKPVDEAPPSSLLSKR